MTSSASLSAIDPREVLLVAIRWSHAAAAAALLGASLFQLLVLGPALRAGGPGLEPLRRAADARFRELLDLSLVVFLISGGLMTFERLSGGAVGPPYVALLGVKLLLSFLLYRWGLAVPRGRGWESREAKLMVAAGFLVLLIATVLKTLYEGGPRA
jgi:hypothetical protein